MFRHAGVTCCVRAWWLHVKGSRPAAIRPVLLGLGHWLGLGFAVRACFGGPKEGKAQWALLGSRPKKNIKNKLKKNRIKITIKTNVNDTTFN